MSAAEYTELRRRVMEAGLLERSSLRTLWATIGACVLLAAGVSVLFLTTNTWIIIADALLLALAYGRFGFLVHDFGHMQVFRRSRWNDVFGTAAATVIGINYPWWRDKHNVHHAETNHEGLDPDIDLPVLAYSEKQALAKRGVARWIVRHQAWMFFIVQLFTSVHLYYYSVMHALRMANRRSRFLHAGLSVLHLCAYLTLVFATQPPLNAIVFILVHQAAWSIYMMSTFAPNHKGMPILEGQTLDFLREQILTARNIRPNPLVDYYYGCLNYQIEHHLFPHMPRHHMRRARRIVQQFCRERGIHYHETGVLQSYVEIIGHLHDISRCLRAPAT